MAKKTRTELSTLAINTNLPDNTQELITPTTERSQLTDERESVVNYKDDLGGTSNAGKFLTVATDGESLTMVDAPTGDVTGTGVAGRVTIWDNTNNITSKAMLVLDDTFKVLKIIIPSENASGGISIDQQGTTGSGGLQFLDDGVYKAQIVYDVSDGDLTLNSNGDIEITPTGDTVISGGTPSVEHVRISSGGNVLIGTNTITSVSKLQLTSSNAFYGFVDRSLVSNIGNPAGFFNSAGTNVGGIATNNTSTTYATSSDYRLKENVTPITDALSRLNQLKPSRFNFIADTDKIVDGFIAHEVQDIIPEAISGEKDAMRDEEYELTPRVDEVIDEEGNVITEAVEAVMETRSVPDYQGIDQSKIVPLLTAAIQEQQTIIQSLITRLEALEA